MIRGTVVGQVWATRKARGLDGQTLLLVAARFLVSLIGSVTLATY